MSCFIQSHYIFFLIRSWSILSCPILTHPIPPKSYPKLLSNPISLCLILSWIGPYYILSCSIPSCCVLSCLVLSEHILSYPFLLCDTYPIRSYPAVWSISIVHCPGWFCPILYFNHILSCVSFSFVSFYSILACCPILSYYVLSCSIQFYCVLSCPIVSDHILS